MDQAERERIRALWQPERALQREGFRLIAGMDEVGRGPLAGPVVAAAVILPQGCLIEGINDSKQLRADQRALLADEIAKQAIAVGVGAAGIREIKRLNILGASQQAMREALGKLDPQPEAVLVDGRPVPGINMHQQALIKGDSLSISIAAASIMAKVARDLIMEQMDELFPGYGFASNKGYATREHLEALAELGPCLLHRRAFAPVAGLAQMQIVQSV